MVPDYTYVPYVPDNANLSRQRHALSLSVQYCHVVPARERVRLGSAVRSEPSSSVSTPMLLGLEVRFIGIYFILGKGGAFF